ncbi:hypothetical protein BGCPKDLD_4353 [Methylorubrum suomiense]|uniref:Uncharacterized protein n=1 Tax=Methylorubrum suomiense TaxID=144191 RepID=A0ABQ4UZH4_9HYPH|nr:hypothetical protein BGCPKDLD_4353 [Methylorubrum suomiense]
MRLRKVQHTEFTMKIQASAIICASSIFGRREASKIPLHPTCADLSYPVLAILEMDTAIARSIEGRYAPIGRILGCSRDPQICSTIIQRVAIDMINLETNRRANYRAVQQYTDPVFARTKLSADVVNARAAEPGIPWGDVKSGRQISVEDYLDATFNRQANAIASVRKGSAADAWGLKRTRRAREAEAARWGKGEGDAHGSRSTNQSAPAARISTPPSTSGSAAPCFTARAMQTTAEAARASGAISSAPQHQAGEARREEASAGRSGRTTIRAAEAGRMLPLGNACGEGGEVEGGRAAHRPAPNACQVGARLATIRPPRTCAS